MCIRDRYLVYASNAPVGNGNKPDIFCRYSDNQGTTWSSAVVVNDDINTCLLYTSDAADERSSVDLGGRRIIKKKKKEKQKSNFNKF